jgi:hypothetical protein
VSRYAPVPRWKAALAVGAAIALALALSAAAWVRTDDRRRQNEERLDKIEAALVELIDQHARTVSLLGDLSEDLAELEEQRASG